ncbi:MAG: cation diffusion facilitator family transporter [Bacteroidales bacterium]|jgi:cation diffusion facilitator family transporter|nr:cation diffusion facilitator family transporter [Bacteroidales bacterium]
MDKDKILKRTSWISVWGNFILSASKIAVGLIAGSLSVLSDGIDSATDVVTSIVILITAGFVSKPPNKKYIYGREKAENIATTILSLVIFFTGAQILITSIDKLIHPDTLEVPSFWTIIIILFSIAGKLSLSLYQFRQGKRIKSSMLQANAINMRNDVILSAGVLVGLAFTHFFKLPIIDPIVAILVSIMIIYSSIGIFRSANLVLMDGMDNTNIYKDIINAVESVAGAENPHGIRVRKVGALYSMVLDIEVEGGLLLVDAHNIAQKVEDSIRKNIENVYDIVVHVEPKGNIGCDEKFGISKENIV